MLDVASSAQAQGLDESDPAVAGLRRQAEDQQAAAQIDLLGETGYQQLKEFERQAPMRSFVDALAGSLAVTGDPLSGPQAGQLAQIMAGRIRRTPPAAPRDDPIVRSFDEPIMAHVPAAEAVDPAEVLGQARGVLSDAQFGALQGPAREEPRGHPALQRAAADAGRPDDGIRDVADVGLRRSRLSACGWAGSGPLFGPFTMIPTETLNQIENIKKRAGHLWRFL